MNYEEYLNKQLKQLYESCIDFTPDDITIKTESGITDEFWTGVVRHVMKKDDFYKKELELFKKEKDIVGIDQAIQNSLERYDKQVQSIHEEFLKTQNK